MDVFYKTRLMACDIDVMDVDPIFNFFEYAPILHVIYFLLLIGIKKTAANNSFMIILFSSVADNSSNNSPWGNNQPPEWVILLSGILVTICVGYSMERAISNAWNYFYPDKKTEDEKSNQKDQTDQFEQKEKTEEDIYMEILLAEKKLNEKYKEQELAEEFTRQLRKFNNGGKHPFEDLL